MNRLRTLFLALMVLLTLGSFATLRLVLVRTAAHAASKALPLHVQASSLRDSNNKIVQLVGADRSGTEWECTQGPPNQAIFDGPSNWASIHAMTSWHINAIRIPLNEDCYLGINLPPSQFVGANYRKAIKDYVTLLEDQGIHPILELHHTAPGANISDHQEPLPDRDHSLTFWKSVANTYKGDNAVLFGLFNEPFPYQGQYQGQYDKTPWLCWRDGTGKTCPISQSSNTGSGITFNAAGMQELVNAVRSTGATNIVMLPGIRWGNILDHWIDYRPADTAHEEIVDWHVYSDNDCSTLSCWQSSVLPVMKIFPVVAGEIGDRSGTGAFLTQVLQFLDNPGGQGTTPVPQGYCVWAWNTDGTPLNLVASYITGYPAPGNGQTYHDYLAAKFNQLTPTPSITPSPGTTIARDTFQRGNQTYWGTASDGNYWVGDANALSIFSIKNNSGQMAGDGSSHSAILGPSIGDASVLVSGSLTAFSIVNDNFGAALRWTDDNDWYKAYIDGTNLILQKKISGGTTILASQSFPASANTSYSLRFQVVGTTLSTRVWVTGKPEPSNWMLTANDSTFGSGYTGLRMLAQAGATVTITSFQAVAQ